ncbi:DUF1194 domain-containing protein [Mesorhizobium sp. WSM3224]|uniref:DUF1194 domain-containing protein n=1 Tax=Mesorhizobium sp. WSM3224 TaxID=1040986 RepID=UPI0006856E20|nr:DUF1194 domain-containing protein [Mesorhizobium sp. WSM3224]
MRDKVAGSILSFDQPDGRANMMPFDPPFAGQEESGRARGWLFALAVSLTTSLSATAAQVSSVDLELVLCVDVSSSMSEAEQRLQREGYVNALHDPAVLQSIESGRSGRIAIAYVEWAGPNHQSVLIPWTVLDGPQDAAAFGEVLRAQPIVRGRGTSISGAILAAGKLLAEGPGSDRRVIDVSGDGPNNAGLPLQPVRDALIAAGVTINGLAISLQAADMLDSFGPRFVELYYKSCVIGGSDAFIVRVDSTAEFATAIRKKLVNEIAGLSAGVQPAAYQIRSRADVDCVTIGGAPGR